MDKPNKTKSIQSVFKSQKSFDSSLSSENVSEDEDKRNTIVIFFKSIKEKFKRCKSSVYKPKQRIATTNYAIERNVHVDGTDINEINNPPPVPIRILDRNSDAGRSLNTPAPYVDISEIIQNSASERIRMYDLCNYDLESDINGQTLRSHIDNLARYGWYWGPLSKEEAEQKLSLQPDGSFLVRDSASQTYLFTISFRCFGRTLHSRIKYLYGKYSVTDEDRYSSVIDLIADGMSKSKNDIFSFSTWNGNSGPVVPVRLIQPVSRFTHVQTLQHLCRFVIRKYIAINNIKELPLPEILKSYLQQAHY